MTDAGNVCIAITTKNHQKRSNVIAIIIIVSDKHHVVTIRNCCRAFCFLFFCFEFPSGKQRLSRERICSHNCTGCHTEINVSDQVCCCTKTQYTDPATPPSSGTDSTRPGALQFVGWLLNVPATCECISGMDLLRQFYVLPH